jgi:KUP system potassium uptake protein
MLMWTWRRGTGIVVEKVQRDAVPMADLLGILRARPPHRVPGTAIFLTATPAPAPSL